MDTYIYNSNSILVLLPLYLQKFIIKKLLSIITSKICRQLNYLSFRLCFDNLIYYLSDDNDRIKNNIKRCSHGTCKSVCDLNECSDIVDDLANFNSNWNQLLHLLKQDPNQNNIKQLYIHSHCNSKQFNSNTIHEIELPGSFLTKFSDFISLFTNLKMFGSNISNFKYYKEIIDKSSSINYISSFTSKQYYDEIVTGEIDAETKFIIDSFTNINRVSTPQIREFKITSCYGDIDLFYSYKC